jgi:hypothetical protein
MATDPDRVYGYFTAADDLQKHWIFVEVAPAGVYWSSGLLHLQDP